MQDDNAEVTAAACRYLLAGLLPRLERLQPGLVDDIRSGIEGDRSAMAKAGTLSPEVDAVVAEALRIVARGAGK